jgi:hypothetical protein
MIPYPPALKASGPAHSGIAPVNLLDVLDVNGNAYYWSDRPVSAPTVLSPFVIPGKSGFPGFTLAPPVSVEDGQYAVWAFPTEKTIDGEASGMILGGGASGNVSMTFDGPFTAPNDLIFRNFQPSILPPGAIVDSCHLVTMYSTEGDEAPFNSAGVGTGDGTAVVSSGLPGPGTSVGFSYHNTVSSGEISTFFGLDEQSCTIYAIGICVIYHLSAAAKFAGGGGGVNPLNVAPGFGPYLPWILSVPKFVFNRSLASDLGSFVLQNLSGDTLASDFEKIARRSALEGAFFIYRLWQPDVRFSWLEVHGTLTVEGIPRDTVSLKGVQLINPASYDTPAKQYSETCQQVIWGGPGCGATGATECQYSFQTCQVLERFLGTLNNYEKNYGEALANVPLKVINRQRRI